ncbi:MAG: hypothetical protein H6556_28150 [Lewinellaceae bacterium]|nr:hypothetical protein [Lewinellaceae bacterium]
MKNDCYRSIAKLLADDKLDEAFSLLEKYLSDIGYSTDLTLFYVSVSAQKNRTNTAFTLGTISWENYDIASSQVVTKALKLAELLCRDIDASHHGGAGGDGNGDEGMIRIDESGSIQGVTTSDKIEEWLEKAKTGKVSKTVYYDKSTKKFVAVSDAELIGHGIKELVKEIVASERTK